MEGICWVSWADGVLNKPGSLLSAPPIYQCQCGCKKQPLRAGMSQNSFQGHHPVFKKESFGYAAWSGVRPLSTRVVNPEILGENYVFADS